MSEQPNENAPLTVAVTEEELEVSRRTVDTQHTLRVRKEVLHEPVEIQTDSFLEKVDVERIQVGRVVHEPQRVRQEGNVTVIPVVEEKAIVVRQLVLVEEIRITRTREVKAATAEATLRKEQVVVERFDPDSNEWLPDAES
jgi:stress response protein YsnF